MPSLLVISSFALSQAKKEKKEKKEKKAKKE